MPRDGEIANFNVQLDQDASDVDGEGWTFTVYHYDGVWNETDISCSIIKGAAAPTANSQSCRDTVNS